MLVHSAMQIPTTSYAEASTYLRYLRQVISGGSWSMDLRKLAVAALVYCGATLLWKSSVYLGPRNCFEPDCPDGRINARMGIVP